MLLLEEPEDVVVTDVESSRCCCYRLWNFKDVVVAVEEPVPDVNVAVEEPTSDVVVADEEPARCECCY